ncbi:MAG: O-antigen ligase family protein [Verrucomicrobia bacterium]|nr:O-antigen ligase family protein [Prolixibacteraceae bacterium]
MNSTYSWKDKLFYTSLFLFAVSLPLAEFMVSISTGLLFISWLLTGNFTNKWEQLKRKPAALLLISIFFVYVLGLFFTHNQTLGIYELRKTIFILIVPLCISTGPKIDYSLFRKVLISFLVTLNMATVIAIVRLFLRTRFGIHDIWEILFVSHIGFTFQLLLGVAILIYELYTNPSISKKLRILMIADIVYLIAFLFILKALTGIVTFAILLFIHLIFIIRKIRNRRWRLLAGIMLPMLILAGFGYIGWSIHRFYDTGQVNLSQLPEKTQNGHPYKHDISNKLLENGHYVGLYICEEEMKKSWDQRSSIVYNGNDANGFPVYATLIRYLTSKGLTKDSVGVSKLTDEDIGYIEKGIANHIYTKRFLSLYPRIYQTIWELDVYFKTGNPNMKSLAKRIEFEKAAFTIIREHPHFGVGTGNWKQAFADAYEKNKSQLDPEEYASAHNQYLNYLVKFGIVGFLWIMFAWTYPLFLTNKHRFYPALMLVLIVGISNFSDSNLEAHMGISFFIFFYSFFLFSETQPETRKSQVNMQDSKSYNPAYSVSQPI